MHSKDIKNIIKWILKIGVLVVLMLAANSIFARAQCLCSGASIGGISPVGDTRNIGVLKKNHFNITTFYRHTYGDSYYNNASSVDEKSKEFLSNKTATYLKSNFIGFLFAHGVSPKLTMEYQISGFINKEQNIIDYGEFRGSGLSEIRAMAKYNLYYSRPSDFELTVGAGVKAPLKFKESELPKFVQAAYGGFGLNMQVFMHKGFKNSDIHLFFNSRTEYSFANSNDYQFGIASYNSFFASIDFFEDMTGVCEFRYEHHGQDFEDKKEANNTGSNNIIFSPQINYRLDAFNIAAVVDIPIYKNVEGYQITNSYSFGLNFSWNGRF